MKIFLLEDELSQQIRVEKHIVEIAKELEIKLEVISTGKLTEFENYIQHSDIHQLYFLDIHIQDNEYCGLEIAKKIRETNPYAIIVFITSRSEFATLTYKYKVSALDFIDKETSDQVFKNRVADCVIYTKSTLLENQSVVDYFDYSYKGNDLCIPYHDILYIETTGTSHKLRIVGKNFAKEFYGTMTDIQEKDKETQRFYLAHKSFLVNIGNVREIDRKKMEVVFYEDHRCPISRLKTKKLRELMAKNQKK